MAKLISFCVLSEGWLPLSGLNEWMNDALYSALLCIAVHPKHFTIMWGGGGGGLSSTTTSVQHPLGWCDGCHRTTAPVRHHTPATGGEERESHRDIKCMRSHHQLQVEGESHRDNQVYALTHQLQVERRESHRDNQVYAHHTQLQVERRES